ncbi:hypothetical protein ABTG05_14430 [Acinetobacter baumannii]
MNAILHGANTCTPKKQASQLIVELGKTISNPQRQTLANLYIAVDTANSLLHGGIYPTLKTTILSIYPYQLKQ